MYLLLKYAHVGLAMLSIGGFLLRAFWMARGSCMLQRRSVKTLPHVIDTVFLLSGIALILLLRIPVLQSPWLLAKLAALVGYIVCGTVALKRGRTLPIRLTALLLAVLAFTYIVGAAISKSPASWLSS